MADYSELKRRAQEIRDEVKAGANTANRVGLALEETVKALEVENKRAEQAEESLENAVQMLQDNTEDLQSIRDEVERLGSDKADKSALEATNKEVSKKQNKLDNYKEDSSNGSVEIFAQDFASMANGSQGGVSCVEVYNEEGTEGIIPVARMSADKENGDYASVTVRGNEVHIEGDGVKVNGKDLESFRTTVINDLTTGGADKALSAEMGKVLGVSVDGLEERIVSRESDEVELLGNGNIKLTLKGTTKEFMPATPSGDPMHYAYETAGAEYNATNDFIIKDAPWKDMVDTIEDKAKWGFDVVDASQVKQMTIKNTIYNYVQTTRQSPEGTTEPRYFLVSKGNNGTWVEDETKVLHIPGHWYLRGLGDITNAEMRRIIENKFIASVWEKGRAIQSIKTRTLLHPYSLKFTDGIDAISNLYGVMIESFGIFDDNFKNALPECCIPANNSIIGNQSNLKYFACLKNLTKITHLNVRVLPINQINTSVNIYSPVISKESIRQNILNANPISAIAITLHANAYDRLVNDSDIVAALEAKNTDLEGTGGSISLVSA